MASDFPYMNSNKNVASILTRIQEAGAPPKFTHEFLKSSLGFASSNDRAIIGLLKRLNFLSEDGTPTDRYHEFRSGKQGKTALASGLRDGWADLFLADQKAHTKTSSQLTDLFKTVTGKSEAVAKKMASTFKVLADAADWSGAVESPADAPEDGSEDESVKETPPEKHAPPGLSLHHDVHVHLPATSDVAVYRAIFRALREELG